MVLERGLQRLAKLISLVWRMQCMPSGRLAAAADQPHAPCMHAPGPPPRCPTPCIYVPLPIAPAFQKLAIG